MRRNWLLVSIVIGLGAYGFYICWHDTRLADFDSISTGMSEEEVFKILGQPDYKWNCIQNFVRNEDKDCAQSLVYSTAIPLMPYYPTIWINHEGKVVKKYTYCSP